MKNQLATMQLRREMRRELLDRTIRSVKVLPPLIDGSKGQDIGSKYEFLCSNSLQQLETCYVPIEVKPKAWSILPWEEEAKAQQAELERKQQEREEEAAEEARQKAEAKQQKKAKEKEKKRKKSAKKKSKSKRK